MEQFAVYGHAIASMMGVALLALLLSPLSAMKKTAAGLAPGATPEQDYSSPVYRWHRCYGNLTESIGTFGLVVVGAMLAGVDPAWVNWLASLYFLSRVLLAVVHLSGIGKPDMSLRSFTYVAGWAMLAILAIKTLSEVI